MVDREKSGKNNKSKSERAKAKSDNGPETGGLASSLDALMSIAESGDQKAAGEIVHLSSRPENDHPDTEKTSDKEALDSEMKSAEENNTRSSTGGAGKNAAKNDNSLDTPGVVELLGALKSDIDSLRKDNEEFKTQLMTSSVQAEGSDGGSGDVRSLLAALKADISELRVENDDLRAQTFAVDQQEAGDAPSDEDAELYNMLAELKDDIVTLRSENDALRKGHMSPSLGRSARKTDEVTMMLRELKSDINDLKHENDSLRIENLAERDGAHFSNLGGQSEAYRKPDGSVFSSLLKGLGALVLVAGAAGGGYYLAKTQGIIEDRSGTRQIASGLDVTQPAKTLTKPPIPTSIPIARQKPTKLEAVSKPAPKATAPAKPAAQARGISTDVEQAMMTRADGLLDARDLGAARMVFVYLARHGSAGAMTRLAQTYDPQYLATQQFDEARNSDLERAIRLYSAASSLGDEVAARRLQEMQQ